MNAHSRRLERGGRIDRSRTIEFTFDDARLNGHPGDTLASALLAAGYRVVATSIHLGRPRGLLAAGVEEPNALVQVDSGSGETMLRATQVELYDGLRAHSLVGRGTLPSRPDTSRYDHWHEHCDVLVIGAGPAGLAAALAAGRTGARVILVDEQPEPGGDLLGSRATLDGISALEWVAGMWQELASIDEVRLLVRTTAVGYYDRNYVVAMERRTDHLGDLGPRFSSRQRLWHIRAGRVVLATGSHERPIVFVDNDLPGVMLASAARTYANRFGVLAGRRAVVATTGDSAYADALDLRAAGVEIVAMVDAREDAGAAGGRLRELGIEVLEGWAVQAALGQGEVTGVRVESGHSTNHRSGDTRTFEADLLAVSGGWNPAVHLFSQSLGNLRFDEEQLCYVPDVAFQRQHSVGAANGTFALSAAIAEGATAGREAAAGEGFEATMSVEVPADGAPPSTPPAAFWLLAAEDPALKGRQFLDHQRDATVLDVERAANAGLASVEHIKRFTTIGTASDQGRTSNVVTNGVLAHLLGSPVASVGTTTYRAPYVAVPFALLAGRHRGELLEPVRTTAAHPWHVRHGAVFENVGQWKRPRYYPLPGEDMEAAVARECRSARRGVAAMDASTLGKIVIDGPDAGALLDRIYTNAFASLAVGSARYGLMCTADGMVFDDGVSARLAESSYLMSTTTGGAARVLGWLEEWLQTEWPDMDVFCTCVTEQWSTIAVVGPRSRDVLAALAPALDVSAQGFPFMTLREADIGGIPARIIRISFSGELAYEINVSTWFGLTAWEAVMDAGREHGITPYGTEAMHVLRAEKGYAIVGQDTDGTVTPLDLGMDWIVSKTKDFVGKRSLHRADTARGDRLQLVGFLTHDPDEYVPEGAQLVEDPTASPPVTMEGHVSSSYCSATLGRSFGLALVRNGRQRTGERLSAVAGDRAVAIVLTDPIQYDPEGARRDG